MEISKAAVAVFALSCVAGAAGGAFFASRGEQPVSAAAPHAEPLVSPAPAGSAVDGSEGIVEPLPAAEPAPAPVPRTAPPATVRPAPAPRTPRPAPAHEAPAHAVEPARPVLPPIEPPQIVANEPSRWVPQGPVFDELVVAADSVLGLQIETSVSSETAQVEDDVVARVTRDVRVGDRVVIPAGSRVQGSVILVERGGRLRERARLGVRFNSIVLADGRRLPIQTDTISREGDSPGTESAAKIGGGAIGGAIIGGILGGARGAAIGGSAGAGAGTAAVFAGGRNPATLPAGTPVTVRLEGPVTVVVER